jgi:hypothetical protein
MTDNEEKFVLEYHTADDPDPQGPPFKYRSYYLDDAVAEGWRLQDVGGRPLCVTRGDEMILDTESVREILERVSQLRTSDLTRDLRDVASEVLSEKP